MSATRMLVLGVVRHLGQAHGYQVRRELLTWRADAWAKVASGSIYQALRTLTKHRLLEQVATEAGAGGPERTVFRITPDGDAEFFHLLRTAIADPDTGFEALNAAFAFLDLLPRNEVVDLFSTRGDALHSRLELAEAEQPWPKPAQVPALMRLHAARVRAEIDWTQQMTVEFTNQA